MIKYKSKLFSSSVLYFFSVYKYSVLMIIDKVPST